MSSRFVKIIMVISGVVAALLLSAVVLAYVAEEKIKEKIIADINRQLSVPVRVDGGIHLSLIRHFPYASLSFKQVAVPDKLRKGKNLLRVKEVSLLCNVFSLFGDKIELSKILIQDGELNIYKNENGQTNLDIFKPKQDASSSHLSVQLKKAEINRVAFTFSDKTQSAYTSINLNNIALKGDFTEKEFDLTANINAHIKSIATGGQAIVEQRKVKAEVVLNVNNNTHKFAFRKGKIDIDGNEFNATGFFALHPSGTQLDFELQNEGKDIQSLFALFPEQYRASFAGADGNGEYSIKANIKGTLTKNSLPQINLDAKLRNSELKLGKYNKLLKNVNATARYESDEKGDDKIIISNFNCTLNDLPFHFKLTLSHLADPDFDFYAQGVLQLSELSSFVPDSVVNGFGGSVTFNDFHLKGRKRDFTDIAHSTLAGSGEFQLKEIEFRQNGIKYDNINGLLRYNNNDRVIDAQNLTLNLLGSKADFTGSVENLLTYIYNMSANGNANHVVLGINGRLKLKNFNLSDIINAYNEHAKPANTKNERVDLREIINMRGNLDVDIDRFVFRKMMFEDITGTVQAAPGMIRTVNMQTHTMGGDARMNGDILFTDNYALKLVCDMSAVGLAIPKIFEQCENFGQSTLTHKHLKGNLNTAVALNATWNNYRELDENTLSAIIDFSIKNGELINFEPLEAASKFIRIEELRDIRFSDLSNTIKIANRRIDIPSFEIKSSALNLIIGGYHYFDNTVDYHFKINLHKLLAQRFSRRQEDVQYIENDPYEGTNIYLSMSGNLSNPVIKYDKATARKKMLSDFKQERQNLKDLFNNTDKKTGRESDKREEKYFDLRQKPQFIDFDTSWND